MNIRRFIAICINQNRVCGTGHGTSLCFRDCRSCLFMLAYQTVSCDTHPMLITLKNFMSRTIGNYKVLEWCGVRKLYWIKHSKVALNRFTSRLSEIFHWAERIADKWLQWNVTLSIVSGTIWPSARDMENGFNVNIINFELAFGE